MRFPSPSPTFAPCGFPRFGMVALATLLMVACGGVPAPPPAPSVADPTHHAASRDAAAAFEAAVALYDLGRFDDAAASFQMLAADFPHDPILPQVELYLGRALVAAGRTQEAHRVWMGLAAEPDWHAAASLYLSWLEREMGDHDRSVSRLSSLLRDRPHLRVTASVAVPGDEPLLGALLAEGRVRAGQEEAAFGDLDLVYRTATSALQRTWAVARAQALLEENLRPAERTRLAQGDVLLARALLLPWLAEEALAAGDITAARAWMADWGAAEGAMVDPGRIMTLQTALLSLERGAARSFGVALSLTGADRRASRAALGSMLLVQRAFEAGEPASILWVEDVGEDPERARDAVRRLHERGALAVIGPIEPRLESAAREEATRLGMTYIGLGPIPWATSATGAWRLQVDAASEARAVVGEAARARGATRVVVVVESPQPAWLQAFASSARERMQEVGGSVVATVEVERGSADLQQVAAAAAERIVRTDADTLVLAVSETTATALVAHLAHQGVWPHPGTVRAGDRRRRMHYLGNSLMMSEELLRNSAEYLVGAIVPVWFDASLATGRAASFALRFQETFGREPGPLEAFAYDAAWMVRQMVVAEGLVDAQRLARRPGEPPAWEGVTGPLRFDRLGNVDGEPSLATVREGRLVLR